MTLPAKHIRTFAGLLPYAVALTVALGLKYHYSQAEVDDLLWMMAPTADLVSRMTGLAFVHDPLAGFVNGELGIAIAPACSGVNFLIVAFGMAFFSFAHRCETVATRAFWVALSLAAAYLLTLGVNSLRIGLSIATIRHGIHAGWLTPDRIHRMEGIVICFFFLCLFYRGLHHFTRVPGSEPDRSRPSVLWVFVPFVWYLAMALAVPLATGNFRDHPERFAEHGLTVCLISLAMVMAVTGLKWIPGLRHGKKTDGDQFTVRQFRPDILER